MTYIIFHTVYLEWTLCEVQMRINAFQVVVRNFINAVYGENGMCLNTELVFKRSDHSIYFHVGSFTELNEGLLPP
jgi:hypothetical protein